MRKVRECDYVELHARSGFSFLRGGSLPEAISERSAELGQAAVAVCDRMGVYGLPRLAGMARETGVRAIHGSELLMEDGAVLPVLVENRQGYRNLCELLTRAHLRAAKGEGRVRWAELPEFAEGLVALTGDEDGPVARAMAAGAGGGGRGREGTGVAARGLAAIEGLVEAFGRDNVWVEIQRHHRRQDVPVERRLTALAADCGLPLLATNGALYATPAGRRVVDVFTCLRNHRTADTAGALLAPNAERYLKSAREMARLFADRPEAVSNTVRLAERLTFRLEDLGYEFPRYPVGPGETMEGVLEEWTMRGARGRYGGSVPEKIRLLLRKELALIAKLGFAGYFLLVADLVRFCRENDILAQGRGSAANSAVCFCLGITAVDPVKFHVLFERFLSERRKGWPDIDIDLPSGERRERVIQEVYRRYGPHGAAMTATVITYRGRSAAREIGKVLGLPADVLDRFSALFASGDFPHTLELMGQMEKAGLPPTHPRAEVFADLYRRVARLPRHLGQHTGGMIIGQGALNRVVPLENASMAGRVVCQWDKDDCEDLGIIKVDLLGLGMMSALQDAVRMTREQGRPVDLAQLPENDPATYEMLREADTIGVFQVESRAQMATLPRMKPQCFYDLVVEVALIRPGPIQGDLAHPYLRRRCGEEAIEYWDPRLKPVLERTLGVPLFQEQMLEIAMEMARFSGDEAEELRKALSFHRSDERMRRSQERLREAMNRAGVQPAVADRIAKAVGSFALYGFPESHAISFAHLAYASAYLKAHRPTEFYAALLNNQPMGFYSAATLLKDATRHGVRVRPVDVLRSEWEGVIDAQGALRLGLRHVRGLRRESGEALLRERSVRTFESVSDLRERSGLNARELRVLAAVGALNGIAAHRRAALWAVEVPSRLGELRLGETGGSDGSSPEAGNSPLNLMNPRERLSADYGGMRLTTGPHPMAMVRPQLRDYWASEDLKRAKNGMRIRVAGLVICRQRPGTAKGICFVSLEDETGITNLIVPPQLFEAERLTLTTEPFLTAEGIVQERHGVTHIRV
ncbi:MAG: DNA polymerase III subunit alpha, partial [Limisphaerales bacterium]